MKLTHETDSDQRGRGGELWWKEGERTSQRTCINDPWTWTAVWELTVGVGDGMAEEGKDPHLIRCSDYVRQLLMLL